MSREIKFRAWDIRIKEFLGVLNNLNIEDFGNLGFTFTNYKKGDLIFCQFTGLLDKNGKEIFEGDILSHRYYSKPVICEFVDGSFIFDDISKYDKSLEVIGNIYQNPELLGGQNG
jgi:hypothetical protein